MGQPEFIFKVGLRNDPEIGQSNELHAVYPDKTKVVKESRVGGLLFQHTETIGTDKSQIQWFPPRVLHSAKTPATAEGVKSVVRRIREQDAVALDAIDAEITALHEQVKAAKRRRRELARKAFSNGNVVRLAEAVVRCEERLPKK